MENLKLCSLEFKVKTNENGEIVKLHNIATVEGYLQDDLKDYEDELKIALGEVFKIFEKAIKNSEN